MMAANLPNHSEAGHVCCPHDAVRPAALAPPQGDTQPGPRQTRGAPALVALKRWLLWFLTFFGIYASSSMCPFCGTPGCPVGAGGAALVGGFFAGLWQYGGMMVNRLRGLIDARRRGQR